ESARRQIGHVEAAGRDGDRSGEGVLESRRRAPGLSAEASERLHVPLRAPHRLLGVRAVQWKESRRLWMCVIRTGCPAARSAGTVSRAAPNAARASFTPL